MRKSWFAMMWVFLQGSWSSITDCLIPHPSRTTTRFSLQCPTLLRMLQTSTASAEVGNLVSTQPVAKNLIPTTTTLSFGGRELAESSIALWSWRSETEIAAEGLHGFGYLITMGSLMRATRVYAEIIKNRMNFKLLTPDGICPLRCICLFALFCTSAQVFSLWLSILNTQLSLHQRWISLPRKYHSDIVLTTDSFTFEVPLKILCKPPLLNPNCATPMHPINQPHNLSIWQQTFSTSMWAS